MGTDLHTAAVSSDIQTYDDFRLVVESLLEQYDTDREVLEERLYHQIEDDVPTYHASHDEIEEAVETIADRLEDHEPDAVVGISRGGNPIATDLSYALEIPYGTVDATHYDGEQRLEEVRIDGEMLHNVEGDIILADNLADTGKTLSEVRDYLQEHDDIDSVTTTTIHKKPHSIIEPDVYIQDTIAWVTYPWER